MRNLTAKDVMNPEVLRVRDDTPVAELAAFLVDHEISGAPVEDHEGNLVGVVSVMDIASAAATGGSLSGDRSNPEYFVHGWEETVNPEEMGQLHVEGEGRLVRDIMTAAIYAVTEETPVAQVAETMIDSHIHRVLVTRGNRVVGIISASDLLGLLVDRD